MYSLLGAVFEYILASTAILPIVDSAPLDRSALITVQRTGVGDTIFKLGDVSYLAHLQRPKASFASRTNRGAKDLIPVTVVQSNTSLVTEDFIRSTLNSYEIGDDVYSKEFLEGVYISSTSNSAALDVSAVRYLESLRVSYLFLDTSVYRIPSTSIEQVVYLTTACHEDLPAGPYVAEYNSKSVLLSSVSRLYEDVYRGFVFGTYSSESGEGDYTGLGAFNPMTWFPYIPVPSRIYSWRDDRPLAGERVAVKDLFDLKGVKTSAGSLAFLEAQQVANDTAPAIQRIVDLGGIIVGKQKTAQFASGDNPWLWQDAQYPWNPRGDGWLTCSASSSAGGCSIAGYDWLDYAIGSDTGLSMRIPAAVAGVYGQRPSQGLMSLEGGIPLSYTEDTAGVFCRDPRKWVKISKLWYTKEMHQPTSITGLSELETPDSDDFPTTVLYATDYLPLQNPAAEEILQTFIGHLTRLFGMSVEKFNVSAALSEFTSPTTPNFQALRTSGSAIVARSKYEGYGRRLATYWSQKYNGRFPPVDLANRVLGWSSEVAISDDDYDEAVAIKRSGVDWYESHIQYSTFESCSSSILIYDTGTGGLPSYREEALNKWPKTTMLSPPLDEYTIIRKESICPQFGCADFTIPIGQVPYWSNVTFHEEWLPVTINLAVKRGCDFVLMNMIEKLADEGVLQTVKTGKTAF